MQVATQAVALGAMIWGLKICLQYLDPYREQREQVRLPCRAAGRAQGENHLTSSRHR